MEKVVLKIEVLKNKDLSVIQDIEKRCHSFPWNYHNLENELSHPFAFHYRFELDQNIIGYCLCSFSSDNLHINNFCIDTIYQMTGYGSFFLKKLIDEARKKNAKTVTLEVDIKNVKALRLYEKQGFKKDLIIRNFYSNGNDAQRMVLYMAHF